MIEFLIVIVFLLILALAIGAVYVFCEDNAKKEKTNIVKSYSDKINHLELVSQAQILELRNRVQTEREAFADYKTKHPMKSRYKLGTEVFVNILWQTKKGNVTSVSFTDGLTIYSVDCSGIVLNGLMEDQIIHKKADLYN